MNQSVTFTSTVSRPRFAYRRHVAASLVIIASAVVVIAFRRMMILGGWNGFDTWTVATAALAAMACALPGVFLVMRQQSMMGDALAHTTLPGVVIAFLLAHSLERS